MPFVRAACGREIQGPFTGFKAVLKGYRAMQSLVHEELIHWEVAAWGYKNRSAVLCVEGFCRKVWKL